MFEYLSPWKHFKETCDKQPMSRNKSRASTNSVSEKQSRMSSKTKNLSAQDEIKEEPATTTVTLEIKIPGAQKEPATDENDGKKSETSLKQVESAKAPALNDIVEDLTSDEEIKNYNSSSDEEDYVSKSEINMPAFKKSPSKKLNHRKFKQEDLAIRVRLIF
jgi:hypothetical protein